MQRALLSMKAKVSQDSELFLLQQINMATTLKILIGFLNGSGEPFKLMQLMFYAY